MGRKIGYIQAVSGCIAIEHQRQELIDFGVLPDHIHDTLEGIVRDGEFSNPNDMLVVYDLGVIGRKHYDEVALNIARGSSEGIYSIKDKRVFKSALPYAQDRLDAMAAINGTEYKGRVIAAKGRAGRQPALEPDQVDRAKALAADGMKFEDIAFKTINRKTKKPVSASTIRRAIK